MTRVTRPRILFLSYGFPRVGSGIGVRTLTFLRSLSRIGDVTFVYRAPEDLADSDLVLLKKLCKESIPIPVASFDWVSPFYRLLDSDKKYLKLIPLLFSKRPIYIHSKILAKNRSIPLRSYMESVKWSDFDVIHIGRFFMADAIMDILPAIKRSGVFTVMDLDDIESDVYDRALSFSSYATPRTWIGKYLSRLDLRRLKQYERKTIPLFDACVVCSEGDSEKIVRNDISGNPWVIPNGVDTNYFQPNPVTSTNGQDILFLGNMSFHPNVDAVRYFAREIFPLILKEEPLSRFVIAGKKPVADVLSLANESTIIVVGEIPDTRPYYSESALVVTPIRYGGGTRVKILEAMAMGKAVVSTSIGAEGIPVLDGKEIVLADLAVDFANQCIRLLNSPDLRASIGQRSREFVVRNLGRDLIETRIQYMYESFLKDR
jgi:glycosyltransferase involved in cell wall biosynthesis